MRISDWSSDVCSSDLPVRHGAAERLRIRNALITAMLDHALADGITRFTGVVEAGFLAQILRMGWRCTTPAPPRRFGGAALGAFIAEIDADTTALLAETGRSAAHTSELQSLIRT